MTKETTDKKHRSTEEIDLVELLKSALAHWKWFVLSLFVCIVLAGTYLVLTPKLYERTSNILIKEEESGIGGNLAAIAGAANMLGMGGMMPGSKNMDNEIFLLTSYHLIGKVVTDLGLDVTYTQGRKDLFGRLPFAISLIEENREEEIAVRMRAEMVDGRVKLSHFERRSEPKQKFAGEMTVAIGDTVVSPVGRIAILPKEPIKALSSKPVKDSFKVAISTHDAATQLYQTKIDAGLADKKSAVLSISTRATVPQKAARIVDALVDIYGADVLGYKRAQAQTTGAFIDERIDAVTAELDALDERIESFKKDNQVFDPKIEAQLWAEEHARYRMEGLTAENQIQMTRFLKEYLLSHPEDLVPGMISVESATIGAQIEAYNEMMLQHNKLSSGNSGNNPVLHTLENQLAEMRRSIVTSLDSHIKTLDIQRRAIQKEESQLNKRILDMPAQEREALELMRQQKIKQELYLYLLSKREESAINQFNDEDTFRVIDRAYGPGGPVSPNNMMILAVAILLGLLIPFGILFLKRM